MKLNDSRKRVVKDVVELVKVPMRKLFALPEGKTLGVVAWLDCTKEKLIARSEL